MERRYLELGVLVAVVIAVTLVYDYGPGRLSWDSAIYVDNGAYFAAHHWLYDEIRPPLLPLLLAVPVGLAGINISLLLVIDLLIRGLCVVVLYQLLRRSRHRWLPLLATAAFALSPIMKDIPILMTEYLSLLFMLLAADAMFKYVERRKMGWIGLSAFCASLAVLSRYTSFVIVPVLAAVVLWVCRKDLRSQVWPAVGALCVFIMPIAAWCIWNYAVFGDPLFSIGRAFMHIQQDAAHTTLMTVVYTVVRDCGALLVAAGLGIVASRRRWQDLDALFLSWIVIYAVSLVGVSHFTPRYLFFLVPPLAYFAWRSGGRTARVAIGVALILSFFIPVQKEDNDLRPFTPIAGLENMTIVGYPAPQIAMITHARTYSMCDVSCDYLRCPRCPFSFFSQTGCEQVHTVVAFSDLTLNLSCLVKERTIGDVTIYSVRT